MLIFNEMICLLFTLSANMDFFMHEINERIFIDFCSLISLLCKMNVQFNKSHFTQLTALVLMAFWSVELLWLNTTKIVKANYSKAVLTPRPETCFSWLIPVCKHFQCHEQIQGWSHSYLQSQNMTMPTLVPILLQNQQGEHLRYEHLVHSSHLLHQQKSKSGLVIFICIALVMFTKSRRHSTWCLHV